MAEHIIKSYTCDRCKGSLGNQRPKYPQDAKISAEFNYIEGPGPSFVWKDLCKPYRKDIF